MNPHQKALVKLLTQQNYRHSMYTVFSDFVELAAMSVANAIDLRQKEAREKRYMQLIGKYEPEEQKRFPTMLGELVLALEHAPGDILGATFGELDMGNARTGQFFTPYELCRLMASVTVGDGADMRAKIAHRGYITVSEPACGAGAQIIALAETMKAAGINYQQDMHVTAVDIDSRAVHMAFLQLSLMHVPAVVVLGNTLTLEEREHWYTPAHILGLWEWRLRRGCAFGTPADKARIDAMTEGAEAPPVPEAVTVKTAPVPAAAVAQISLFDTEAA